MVYDMKKILIVGCGGTGSNLIKELARYISFRYERQEDRPQVVLIDGDVVETKNLERQSFDVNDVHQNKAEAMSMAVNDVFDVDFSYYPQYITEIEQLKRLTEDDLEIMIVGCVDNHNCRQVLHAFFQSLQNGIYIDAANEYSGGEVVCGIRVSGIRLYKDRAELFPEILKPSKSVIEMSCEELNNSEPQHLVTNLMSANICLSLVVQVLNGILKKGGIYYFDAFQCNIQRRDDLCLAKK